MIGIFELRNKLSICVKRREEQEMDVRSVPDYGNFHLNHNQESFTYI